MRYETRLASKDINAVVKQLRARKKELEGKMVKEFFFECCRKLILYANDNIQNYPIGDNVLSEIISGWEYQNSFTGSSIILRNTAEKAAYVEFGVGVVAESNPHPKADDANYEYNKPSSAKDWAVSRGHPDGTWSFFKDQEFLDLPPSALDYSNYLNSSYVGGTRMYIRTRGTEPTMFLFDAILKFTNNGDAVSIWTDIKRKYWG